MEKHIKNRTVNLNMRKIILLFILLLSINLVYADAKIIEYRFEEGGGAIVLDTSGFNNHGTATGVSWQIPASKFGTFGLDFDGNGDFITTITNLDDLPEDASFTFWVKPDVDNKETILYSIFENGAGFETQRLGYDYGTDTAKFYYHTGNGTSNSYTIQNFTLIDDGSTWHHIALVLNFSASNPNDINVSFYLDTVLVDTMNRGDFVEVALSQRILYIGTNSSQVTAEFYDGDMDEFSVYDFTLSAEQIN